MTCHTSSQLIPYTSVVRKKSTRLCGGPGSFSSLGSEQCLITGRRVRTPLMGEGGLERLIAGNGKKCPAKKTSEVLFLNHGRMKLSGLTIRRRVTGLRISFQILVER